MTVLLRQLVNPERFAIIDHFPFTLGRRGDDLEFAGPGVWQGHAQIDRTGERSIRIKSRTDTTLVLNGMTVREASLKVGDVIQLGGDRFRLELQNAAQKAQVRWEIGVLILGVGLVACEMWLALGWLPGVR